jgi:shikimate kinase
MTGTGISHGAITVINAMPAGIGATIGVSLKTVASFTTGGHERIVRIKNDPSENTDMARFCVSESYDLMKKEEPEGWILDIDSEIPISRGLKSSSSACNAIIAAVMNENGFAIDDVDLIKLGVICAKRAKVTVTGSFDDACGCHLGGFVITDNKDNIILFRDDIEEYDVLIHVPEKKIRKTGLPLEALRALSPQIMDVIKLAKTDPLKAMTENGRLISSVSDVDNSVAEIAMRNGALGAGMSGSGPAIAIVLKKGDAERFLGATGLTNIIRTTTRSVSK